MSKPTTLIAMLITTTLLCLAPTSASAYTTKESSTGNNVRWPAGTIRMRIGADLARHLGESPVRSAAIMASEAWRGLPGVPDIEIEPGVASVDGGTSGPGGIYLVDPWTFGESEVAVTATSYLPNGEIINANIYINPSIAFELLSEDSGDDDATPHDLGAVLAHEFGHVLGLDESLDDKEATMWPYIEAGETHQRTLSDDDEQGIIEVYSIPLPAVPGGCSVALQPRSSALQGIAALFILLLAIRRRRGRRATPPKQSDNDFANDYVAYVRKVYLWTLPIHTVVMIVAARRWESHPVVAAVVAGQAAMSLVLWAAIHRRPEQTLAIMRQGIVLHLVCFIYRLPYLVITFGEHPSGLDVCVSAVMAGVLALHTVFSTRSARRLCLWFWAAAVLSVLGPVAALWIADGASPQLILSALRFGVLVGAAVGLSSVMGYMHESGLRLLKERMQFEQLAMSDALTGIPNRRAFDTAMDREFARSHRGRTNLCAAIVDIDHFKKVNDTHGHDVGDNVLTAVARIISSQVRASDEVARWGGEEFGVIMPDADEEQGSMVAERIRVAVERHDFGIEAVTVSIGLAQLDGPGDSPDELLKRADNALYDAKAGGRNRVNRAAARKAVDVAA